MMLTQADKRAASEGFHYIALRGGKRVAYCTTQKEAHREAGRPVAFLDESGFAHDMPRSHGYASVGTRCGGRQDWHAKGRTNVIGALLGASLLTVSLFQGTVNSDVFHAWTTQDLLTKLPPGCVIVMDNAAFHKRADIRQAVEDAGSEFERSSHRRRP